MPDPHEAFFYVELVSFDWRSDGLGSSLFKCIIPYVRSVTFGLLWKYPSASSSGKPIPIEPIGNRMESGIIDDGAGHRSVAYLHRLFRDFVLCMHRKKNGRIYIIQQSTQVRLPTVSCQPHRSCGNALLLHRHVVAGEFYSHALSVYAR